jgi:nitrilase
MSEQTYKVAAVQAAPVFMDLAATVDKGIALIEEAARDGARLIAFPECWIPGYPWWVWLSAAAHNVKYFGPYHENSLVVDSLHFKRLCAAAKANSIFVSMGASERDHGSLYMAQFLIDDQGFLVKARRKLKPTFVERTVFGEGDGSDLEVSSTSIGRIGQLCCWEHLQPLTKYAMFSLHEQIHIGAWPSFSCYPQAYSLGPELNTSVSRVYAAEGQCFVIAACAVISKEMVEMLAETPAHDELIIAGGGHTCIFGPDGGALGETLESDQEGIVFAEIDLGAIAVAKCFADPVGHYSRPDVTQLLLNRSATPPVQYSDAEHTLAPATAQNEQPDSVKE